MRPTLFVFGIVLFASSGLAAPRTHTVVLGKWRIAEVQSDSGGPRQIKVRELIIDGRTREYTIAAPHEVTDRLFVLRRAYRINDSLPDDSKKPTQWIWRLGGWISVDRQTGHIAQLNLPAFDGDLSDATWYRDYAAYCGASDDGSKSYMVVSQLGKRKPILKKEYAGEACPAPKWDRSPSRVTFMAAGEKSSFVVHAHGADPQMDSPEEEGQQ
jgi:hypothetical protein